MLELLQPLYGPFFTVHSVWSYSRLLKGDNFNPFTTSRDSKSTALKWRSSVSLSDALAVQKYCSNEMQKLGYLLVNENLSPTTEVIADLPYKNE